MAVTDPVGTSVALTHFAGRAGDHNDRAMVGSRFVSASLAARFAVEPAVIGSPRPALSVGWEEELASALPELREMSRRYQRLFDEGVVPVTALSRCAVALVTLPVVAAHRPDAVVVWFDAHADLNTPETTTTGYLGGLAFSGPMGWWDSGLGAGLHAHNGVLVGVRDVDADEEQLIADSPVQWVKVGPNQSEELRRAVADRPAYVHIDCDVLEPGAVLTDYIVPDGLTLADLRQTAEVLAESEIVGIEIGEFEAEPDSDDAAESAANLFDALEPILLRIGHAAASGHNAK
jgi:arginase